MSQPTPGATTRPPIPAPPFKEQMARQFGIMEQALYTVENLCPITRTLLMSIVPDCDRPCPFNEGYKFCTVPRLRKIIGDHVFPGDPDMEAAALEDIARYEQDEKEQEIMAALDDAAEIARKLK